MSKKYFKFDAAFNSYQDKDEPIYGFKISMAEFIKTYRQYRGMSIEEVSRLSGITASVLSSIEEKHSFPIIEIYLLILSAIGCTKIENNVWFSFIAEDKWDEKNDAENNPMRCLEYFDSTDLDYIPEMFQKKTQKPYSADSKPAEELTKNLRLKMEAKDDFFIASPNHVYGLIAPLRLSKGIRLVDCAKKAGIAISYLSQIETGTRCPTVYEVPIEILSVLGIQAEATEEPITGDSEALKSYFGL